MTLQPRLVDRLTLLASMAAGALAFHSCVGLAIANPTNADWIFTGGVDPSIHYVGWHMFRFAPWGFPPGVVPNLGFPVGTSIALTDSIPLLAFAGKLTRSLLPETFQYLGPWLLLCFVLQGLFGALLVGTVTRNPVVRLSSASMFVLAPILTNRLNHAALCGHWLLLAALWLNRRRAGMPFGASAIAAWAVLTAIAAGTHPYITVMVLAIAAATVMGQAGPWRSVLFRASLTMAAMVAIAGMVWWTAGYFIVSDSLVMENSGFGRLSMNLLSPLIPPDGSLLFRRLRLSTAGYDQHEGFSYLGLGGLVVCTVALLLLRRPRTRADATLLIAAGGLTLFALSPVVTLGQRTLLSYPAAWWGPLVAFRASGRMFWPVWYAMVFAAIAAIVRRVPLPLSAALLLCAAGLQALDARGVHRLKRTGFALRAVDPLPSDFWAIVPRFYRHLVLYPSNMCAPMEQSIDYRFFALHAGRAGATLNGGYAARYDAGAVRAYCDGLADDMRARRVVDDTLYVVPGGSESMLRTPGSVACVKVDQFAACFTMASHDAWASEFPVNERFVPAQAEFLRFREVLEEEYRDRLHRPLGQLPGTVEWRTTAMARYLGYRIGGCTVQEATAHALESRAGAICRDQATDQLPVPSDREVADLETAMFGTDRGTSATHVDPEGEVVWTRTYTALRLQGRSAEQATAEVLGTIRSITGQR